MREIDILLSKYLDGKLATEERLRLLQFLSDADKEVYILNWIEKKLDHFDASALTHLPDLSNERADLVFRSIIGDVNSKDGSSSNIRYLITGWRKYAAIFILVACTIVFYIINQHGTGNNNLVKDATPELILPINENAILTLSDGTQVVLNDSVTKSIADGSVAIEKSNGLLTYKPALTSSPAKISYNTMSTPRGGQYQLVLPDGTKVWLNAASAIKYPTVFHDNNRVVELTGEAYFEVKHNKSKPFFVKTKNTDITVLGTEFNVNSYDNEPNFAATLVEGSIKVSSANNKQILKPGQQANIDNNTGRFNVLQPNLEEVLAWRTGVFQFEDANIKTIMRQIERWYDITVEYRGAIPDAEFSGSLRRTESANGLLNALSLTKKVHFVVENKKIIVSKEPVKK